MMRLIECWVFQFCSPKLLIFAVFQFSLISLAVNVNFRGFVTVLFCVSIKGI